MTFDEIQYSREPELWTTQLQYSKGRVGLVHSVESDRRAALILFELF